jgi:hypothetical protein
MWGVLMKRIRNVTFLVLVCTFALFSVRTGHASWVCDSVTYGYGVPWAYGPGDCEYDGTIECADACDDCFNQHGSSTYQCSETNPYFTTWCTCWNATP